MSVMYSTIKVSIGSTVTLGLRNFNQNYPNPTIYLLTPGKCLRDCKYCSLAKSSNSDEKYLSRVVWPSFEIEDVIQKILKNKNKIKRVCIQTVNNRFSKKIYTRILKEIGDKFKVSVSINSENDELIKELFSNGVDRVGIPIDVATEKNYEFLRGGDFFKKINFILKTGRTYEGKISTHIIVGLNETDFEILNLYKLLITNKINVGLFAFTPVKGSYLEKSLPPKIIRYRKIQIGTKLIELGYNIKDFKFKNNGELIAFPKFNLDEIIKLNPFNTRGCPDCNRPFYNERPTGAIYNYPFPVKYEQTEKEIVDLGLDKIFI